MLWTLTDTHKLSKKIKAVITDPENRIVVSAISFWEVSLKASLRKIEIAGFAPEDLPSACIQMGFDVASLGPKDCSSYHRLRATYHKDPFDRMLIWMAISNDYTLISADNNVKKYTSEGLQILTA